MGELVCLGLEFCPKWTSGGLYIARGVALGEFGHSDLDRVVEIIRFGSPLDKPMTVCGKTGLIRTQRSRPCVRVRGGVSV